VVFVVFHFINNSKCKQQCSKNTLDQMWNS